MEGLTFDESSETPREASRRRLIEGIEELRYRRIQANYDFDFAAIELKSIRAERQIMFRADEILEESLKRIPSEKTE